jgi:O-succinylbenzoate synthase
VQLLTGDLVREPLLPVAGALPVVRPEPEAGLLARWAATPDRAGHWERRLAEVMRQDQQS